MENCGRLFVIFNIHHSSFGGILRFPLKILNPKSCYLNANLIQKKKILDTEFAIFEILLMSQVII